MRTTACIMVLIGCVAAGGCVSPESNRARGGPGADVGNRGRVVETHGGSDPFWKTPDRLNKIKHGPLESAEQARQLSEQ
jgi:hypothetical protein